MPDFKEKTPSSSVEDKPRASLTSYRAPEDASDTDNVVLHHQLGYEPDHNLRRNRSLFTLLFQSLAIAAIPYGQGSTILSAVYGGGQLSIFVGWIVVCILNECVAISLAELASRWPTSAGPHYWSFQLAKEHRALAAYATGWIWLIGNLTITLSVNFGFASLISACITLYDADFTAEAWQLLLIFYAVCLFSLVLCVFANKILPYVDTASAAFTAVTIVVTLIALSVKAGVGRSSISQAFGNYDKSLAGWGGFTFFIGLLPAAYTFSGIGMITSMAEECRDAAVKLPQAIALCIPVGGIAGLFFVMPICFTMPSPADIVANAGSQALPYIYATVMDSPGGGLALTFLVLVITLFCSLSITVAASRCLWAFARDAGTPMGSMLSRIHPHFGVPIESLVVLTVVQMLLGLINLGSTSAFTAFVSVGVVALSLSYGVPIVLSMANGRAQVSKARFRCPGTILGWVNNVVSLAWILFELVLFCMPTSLPTTSVAMNYASVVLVGLCGLAGIWYAVHARKVYRGPPEENL